MHKKFKGLSSTEVEDSREKNMAQTVFPKAEPETFWQQLWRAFRTQ